MRTTVEIPDPLYRRVKAAAVERGIRGFSPIVEEALEAYLAAENRRQDLLGAFRAAEGAWSDADVAELEEAVSEAWATWPSARS